jgi:hypothetical protein
MDDIIAGALTRAWRFGPGTVVYRRDSRVVVRRKDREQGDRSGRDPLIRPALIRRLLA